ncbi:MAG: thiamine phosphate synthase [Ignavibacteriae bacterium]|nr:MAG: thiamine phosphate synthase [Ignavibacteriota bacterium]
MESNKPEFKLLLITDRKKCKDLIQVIDTACRSGIKAVQLREKDIPAVELLSLSKELRKITKKHSAMLLINDRLDICLLSKADGVHSPEKGFLPQQIKRNNKKLIAGISVHSVKSAVDAEKNGYDYIIAGPVFRTASKIKYGKPLGLSVLKNICDSVNIQVYAVGRINPERAKKCIAKGAYGVAVISAIMKSKNIKKTVSEFKKALGGL